MTSARETISLGEITRERTDCRSEVTEGLLRGKKNTTDTTVPYRCVVANCRNVVDLSKFVHNITSFGD